MSSTPLLDALRASGMSIRVLPEGTARRHLDSGYIENPPKPVRLGYSPPKPDGISPQAGTARMPYSHRLEYDNPNIED